MKRGRHGRAWVSVGGMMDGKVLSGGLRVVVLRVRLERRVEQRRVEPSRQREGKGGGQSSGQRRGTVNPRQPGAVAMGAEVLKRAGAGLAQSTSREQAQDVGAGRDVDVVRERLAQEAEAKKRVQRRENDGLAARG